MKVVWISADFRGHPSQHEIECDLIGIFERAIGVAPTLSYGVCDGLRGMILEAQVG